MPPLEQGTPAPAAGRILRATLVALVGAILAAAALLLAWPQAFGAQRIFGVAQLIAFRPVLGIGLGACAAVAALLAVSRRASRTRRAAFLALAVMLALAAAGQGAVLAARGWDRSPAPQTGASTAAVGGLTVVSWNVQGGATGAEDIARLALAAGADVVALPEAGATLAAEAAAILGERGLAMRAHTLDGRIPTSVLIAERLGDYSYDGSRGSTPELPSGVWIPADPDQPALVIAHPFPPVPGGMPQWRAGLEWVAEQCGALGPNVIVAGDLNATVDHLGDMRGCGDAALAAGAAASGTWPAAFPAGFASPIDHVLTGADWEAAAFHVGEAAGGSDHRPVIAALEASG